MLLLSPSHTAAFSLSSGTIGAALSSSLSRKRAIALSYGTVEKPTPAAYFEPAHALASRIVRHLWANWGLDAGGARDGEVDLYSVNIPMIQDLLGAAGPPICWTRMWRNSYGRLFTPHARAAKPATSPAGPDSLDSNARGVLDEAGTAASGAANQLVFKFSPAMEGLINPEMSDIPVGSDGWAIAKGWVSVTPLRASFAEPAHENMGDTPYTPEELEKAVWKYKL